jgi:hypothetical protein
VRVCPRLFRSLQRAEVLQLVGKENFCADMAEVAQRIGATAPDANR